jgi:hypothetical protein
MANFKHLLAMSDERGVFEHAFRAEPKRDHGYCSDDVGRALVVAVREPEPTTEIIELGLLCTRYLAAADLGDGRYRNRMNVAGEWGDEGASDDASGRAIWGIGSAFARGTSEVQAAAAELVDNAMLFRSPFPRATAVAVLGAAEVLHADPTHDGALLLLQDALFTLPRGSASADWPWPEDRLKYANALFPDALSAAGFACGDTEAVVDGLDLLAWLVEVERRHDHFSFTPTGGWAPGEPPWFRSATDRGRNAGRRVLASVGIHPSRGMARRSSTRHRLVPRFQRHRHSACRTDDRRRHGRTQAR